MILNQSNYSQIESNQSFTKLEDKSSLQLKWKDVDKKKRRKFSHLYRFKLKKELKRNKLNSKKLLKKSQFKEFDKENIRLDFVMTAHNDLFDKYKKSNHITPKFYTPLNSKNWKSKRHIGYTSHGESLWKK